MKKFLCAVIALVLVMSLCSVVNAARKKSIDEMSDEEIEAELQRRKDEDVKLQIQAEHERKQRGEKVDDINEEKTAQSEGRTYRYGLDKWRKGAKYQLTNWSFSPDKVTAELIDRKGKVVRTLHPVKLSDGGFQLQSGGIPQGTQLIVPEGCLFCGNAAYVGKSPKSGTADFEEGESVYYFAKDPKYGFTIFPYYKPVGSQSQVMPEYEE